MSDPLETSILNTSVSDQAAAKDSLGFEPYVKAIAEFLTNPQTKPPLTLSVEGEWGSGKSSFMNQLKLEIEEKSQKQLTAKLVGVEKWIRRFLLKIFYGWPQKLEGSTYNRLLRVLLLLLLILPSRSLLFIFDAILSLLFKGLKRILPHFIRQPRTVWFNAWRHDKAEELWVAFALEFICQISKIRGISDVLPVLWGH
ncbi:MAG: P-loop NTPase fold protein, partial [Waterburya sp.]